MFGKQVLALFLWCHCYQIVLNPLLTLFNASLDIYTPLTDGLRGGAVSGGSCSDGSSSRGGCSGNILVSQIDINSRLSQAFYVTGSLITANRVTLTPGQEIVLKCDIIEYPQAKFSWSRIRKYSNKQQPDQATGEREKLEQTDPRYIISNNSIIIKSSTFNDVGDYFCQVENPKEGIEEEKMILVRPKPYIHEFDIDSSTSRSAVVEEGQALKLICNIVDDYSQPSMLNVTWHMSKYDENDMDDVNSGEDGIRLEALNSTSHALIIDQVTKDHRRLYKCQVNNGITENSKAILIRVKNKLIVIWPAVFIAGELVILIGIIIFAENRKVEPDKGSGVRKAKL